MNEEDLQNSIQDGIKDYMSNSQYGVVSIPSHLHNGMDTPKITVVDLPVETPIRLGLGEVISFSGNKNVASGNTKEETILALISGKDTSGTIGITSPNMQVQLEHYPNDTNNFSFLDAFRNPLLSTPQNTTISVTAGGNTVTISNYGLVTNALAGALINISNANGDLVETQTIASNTASVITITGTWLNTTTGGSFLVFVPVFLGRSNYPWQRVYVMEGTTTGGVRFGVGPTNAGQNGLLYMDSAGDIFWRNKAGSSVKLNSGGTGTVTSVAVASNGIRATVTNPTTTPNISIYSATTGIMWAFTSGPINDVTTTSIPSDGTKFLNGDNPPSFAQVKDSDLSLTDITTNNVSSTKHGFAPKFPNNTTTFFRGDGTYAALPGSNATYTNGVTTYNLTTASGNQTIAHGLGSTPSKIRIIATSGDSVNSSIWSEGTYNGTTMSCIYLANDNNNHNSTSGGQSSSFVVDLVPNTTSTGDGQSATVTFDATNITLAWTKNQSPTGTAQILWEANS